MLQLGSPGGVGAGLGLGPGWGRAREMPDTVRKQLQRRKTMKKKKRRRKKKRKRRKSNTVDSRKPFLICNVWPDFSSQQIPDEHSCQEQSSLSMKMDFKSNEGQRLLVFDLSFVVICDFPVAT